MARKLPGAGIKKRTDRVVLTGLKNVVEYVDPLSLDDETAKPTAKPHGFSLRSVLTLAKKGSEDTITDQAKKVQGVENTAILPADQLASLHSILATVRKNHEIADERDHWERERLRHIINLDINGNQNYSDDPVYYRPSATLPKSVAGVPYLVSDIVYTCNRCTHHRKCERHGSVVYKATDVSLCDKSHLRMKVYYDGTDPDNCKGTWLFGIEEKFDRFAYPKEEREAHERAQTTRRKAWDNGVEVSEHEKGCCPVDPRCKIKQLAKRVIEDYNSEAKIRARKEFLDPKGREYSTKPIHWGGKDPFTMANSSCTRAALHYVHMNVRSNIVERELRVLLQAWHKSQLKPKERMRDRTTADMKEAWTLKMEQHRALRLLKNIKADDMQKQTRITQRQTQKVQIDQHEMTVGDLKKLEITNADKPKAKAASRDLTTKERKILKQMSKAAEVEVQEAVEKEALVATQIRKSTPESEEERVVPRLVDEKTTSTEAAITKKTSTPKRKASEVIDNKRSGKKFKSTAIIEDSDDEANYELSKAPEFELPRQREGWEFVDGLSTDVKESVKVVQSDELKDATETMVVVEQGTSIVKEIEVTPEVAEVFPASPIEANTPPDNSSLSPSSSSSSSSPAEATTPPPYRSPTPSPTILSTLPSSKKRKISFTDFSDSCEENNHSPVAKKVKKTGFSSKIVSPRRVSAVCNIGAQALSEAVNEVSEVDIENEVDDAYDYLFEEQASLE